MKYSLTQLGNLIKLVSSLLLVAGFTITPEQQEAIVIVVGLILELVGFMMSWFGRMRMGDISALGFKKNV